MMSSTKEQLRALRVVGKQLLGIEPKVRVRARRPLEFHGNGAGGWSILRDSLGPDAVVVDVGLGEDISFSESIIAKYGCVVHGFDPTPRAIQYVRTLGNPRLRLWEYGLGASAGTVDFFLPNNETHVSGSVMLERHLGRKRIAVPLLTIGQLCERIGSDRIDVLKLDIEGTEYDVIQSEEFQTLAPSIGQLCVEFHHRWDSRGKGSTEAAVARLAHVGFECIWFAPSTNEEFTFVQTRPRTAG